MEKYAKVRFLLNFQTWQIAVYTFENNSIMVEMESSANLYPHRGTIGRGGGGGWNPFPELLMGYILGVVALLEACDVINNGRHLGLHLGFYQELEIRLKL